MSHNRMLRIADQIQRDLADMLRFRVSDPRFQLVTITHVDVSPDMANALVLISALREKEINEIIAALNKAAGFFRHELAQSLNLRITPRLKFAYDESLSRGSRISRLLNEADKGNGEAIE